MYAGIGAIELMPVRTFFSDALDVIYEVGSHLRMCILFSCTCDDYGSPPVWFACIVLESTIPCLCTELQPTDIWKACFGTR